MSATAQTTAPVVSASITESEVNAMIATATVAVVPAVDAIDSTVKPIDVAAQKTLLADVQKQFSAWTKFDRATALKCGRLLNRLYAASNCETQADLISIRESNLGIGAVDTSKIKLALAVASAAKLANKHGVFAKWLVASSDADATAIINHATGKQVNVKVPASSLDKAKKSMDSLSADEFMAFISLVQSRKISVMAHLAKVNAARAAATPAAPAAK